MSVRPEVRRAAAYHFTPRPAPIKLDQNESPYDLPRSLKARVFERLAELPWNRYPELGAEPLRAALATYHGWDEAGVVVAGGSNVLIQAFVAACGLTQRVLSVTPTFAVYGAQARLLGAPLTEVPLEAGFALPTKALQRELQRGPGVLFLANPAAPTGNAFAEAELQGLLAAADGWTVVFDEAYCQFADTDLLPLVRAHPNAASLRTFSKAFGLGGVRLGYALTSPDLARDVQKLLLPFSVSALQLATGLTVLEAPEYVAARASEARRERDRLQLGLAALPGIEVFASQANFVLFRVGDAEAFFNHLLGAGVLVRRQDHLPGLAGCLRVSVGTPAENGAFLAAARAAAEALADERPRAETTLGSARGAR
jgi:histidinol-phosphate aminotransferase